jgi:hypothetical protein
MAEQKIYCGTGKIVTTKYGDLTKISFSQKDIDTLQENINNGWVNLVLKEKKEKIDGKPTHYLEVDAWKPTPKDQPQEANGNKADDYSDNLPF